MDQDLVVRAQKGERRAFEALAAADYPRLFRLAYGILRDRQAAEDASQDALVGIWRNLRRLRDPARFEAWSYRLLVNTCHDHIRRRSRWLPESTLARAHEPTIGDAAEGIVERDEVERALTRLSVEHRVVLAFRFLLDMTPDEIADTLEVPRKTVYSRLRRATDEMRAVLEAQERTVIGGPARQEALR
jgi:RNA polymerase sigma-70 factor (ECF subfamily)